MDQNSKDSVVIWIGTVIGAAGGWWGVTRLAATYAVPLGTWGAVGGGLIGAIAGATVTKMVVNDPGAIPQLEGNEH